jgi:hypothetical protein
MTRQQRLIAAYERALGDSDPDTVDVLALLPSIFDEVPDATGAEIAAALRASAAAKAREADSLQRYLNAKFGNAGKVATPGDGVVPFKRRTRR